MKILFIDDEPTVLEQGKIFLEKMNDRLDVKTAPSAEEGLELLDKKDYDAIIADYQMPKMNGLELLKVVREERESSIPFIVFTGKGREDVAMEALNLGVDRYLQKGGSPKSQYSILAQAVAQEIKHQEAEWEKAEIEEKLTSLVEGSEDPIYIVDENCRIVFANEAEKEKTGLKREEIIGSKFRKSHPEKDAIKFEKKVEKALETGEPQKQEIKHETSRKYYSRTLSPIEDPRTGKINRVAVVSKDITKTKRKEETLNTLVLTMHHIAFVLDEDGRYREIFISPDSESLLYKSKDDLLGKKIPEIFPEEKSEEFMNFIEEVLKTGDVQEIEYELEVKEGIKKFEMRGAPLERKIEGKRTIAGVARDITEWKETKKKYKTLFNELSDALFLESTDGEILDVNKAACETFGYDYEELTNMNVGDLVPGEAPAFLPGKIDKATREGKPLETVNKRKDGTPIPVELRGRIIEFEEEERMLVSVRDISERKKAQERKNFLHSLLRHDVRNKNQVVQGYLELLEETDLSQKQEELVKKAKRGSKEGSNIIEKVRTLHKIGGEEEIEEVNVGTKIKNAIKRNESLASEKEKEIECEGVDVKVRGGTLLEELFSNLIENAIIHADCEKIRISCQKTQNKCIVTVEDDGKGVPDEVKEKIFNRGFKDDEEGSSGLGTYLVKKIAESYGGNVEVKDSELGGARFDVYLDQA